MQQQMQPRMSIRQSTGYNLPGNLRINMNDFIPKCDDKLKETKLTLERIFEEAGYEEIERQCLFGDLLSKLQKFLDSELTAEQQILEHAKQQVIQKFNYYCDLHTKLGRAMPQSVETMGNNYTDKLAELEKRISLISTEVKDRQKLIDVEMNVISEIVSKLGEELPNPSIFSGPPGTHEMSDLRLNLMRKFKETLAEKVSERQNEISRYLFTNIIYSLIHQTNLLRNFLSLMLSITPKRLGLECFQLLVDLVVEEEGFGTTPHAEDFTDYMINEDGTPNTAHTLNPVPLFLISNDYKGVLRPGKLGDLAPTMLKYMGLNIPADMTGNVLID